jgi:hypothetical protein
VHAEARAPTVSERHSDEEKALVAIVFTILLLSNAATILQSS